MDSIASLPPFHHLKKEATAGVKKAILPVAVTLALSLIAALHVSGLSGLGKAAIVILPTALAGAVAFCLGVQESRDQREIERGHYKRLELPPPMAELRPRSLLPPDLSLTQLFEELLPQMSGQSIGPFLRHLRTLPGGEPLDAIRDLHLDTTELERAYKELVLIRLHGYGPDVAEQELKFAAAVDQLRKRVAPERLAEFNQQVDALYAQSNTGPLLEEIYVRLLEELKGAKDETRVKELESAMLTFLSYGGGGGYGAKLARFNKIRSSLKSQ